MGYVMRQGRLVKVERLRRPKPQREPIKPKHHHQLFTDGPVKQMARQLAHSDLVNSLRAKGIYSGDLPLEHQSVTVLVFNAQEYYFQKATYYLNKGAKR